MSNNLPNTGIVTATIAPYDPAPIPAISPEHFGEYTCVAYEMEGTTNPTMTNVARNIRNSATAVDEIHGTSASGRLRKTDTNMSRRTDVSFGMPATVMRSSSQPQKK